MKKILKYGLVLVTLIIALILLGMYVLLYTESGAKWTLNYLTNNHLKAIQIKSIEGSLANQLHIREFKYIDEKVIVEVDDFIYSVENLGFISQSISLASININHLSVKIINSEKVTKQTESMFEGLQLPFQFTVDDFNIKLAEIEQNENVETFKDINLSLQGKEQKIEFNHFEIQHDDAQASGFGFVNLDAYLSFEVSPHWTYAKDSIEISGAGLIEGNINELSTQQTVSINNNQVDGQLQLQAKLDLIDTTIEAQISSDTLNISVTSNRIKQLKNLIANIQGDLNGYTITSELELLGQPFGSIDAVIAGTGDLNSLNLHKLELKQKNASIKAPSSLRWHESIELSSQLLFAGIDPSMIVNDWNGMLNGQAHIKSIINENDYVIEINELDMNGKLNNQSVSLLASGSINPKLINMTQFELLMGDNFIEFEGTYGEQLINGNFKGKLADLSVIDQNLAGKLDADINIVGQTITPQFNGHISGSGLAFNSHKVAEVNLNASGTWPNDLVIDGAASELLLNDQNIIQLTFDFAGGLAKHSISLVAEDELLSTELKAEGQFNMDSKDWQGSILNHILQVKAYNSHWQLDDKVALQIGDQVTLSKACWLDQVNQGSFCTDLFYAAENEQLKANLSLERLDINTLGMFVPNELSLIGFMQGGAVIDINKNDIKIDADIALQAGELIFAKGLENEFKAQINKATVLANHFNQRTKIVTEVQLSDGSSSNIELEILNVLSSQPTLNGSINSYFAHSRYLASLSDELKELKGSFNINGSISGQTDKPIVHLKAQQNEGYMILAQTGTKIENISFGLNQDDQTTFKFVGQSGKGQILIDGGIEWQGASWQINAAAKGENFRLLTLPEIELDISPTIKIFADSKGLNLTGEVVIPYGAVNIVQLPDSAINTSADVNIHQENVVNDTLDDYKIKYDLDTKIESIISINALGLVSDLSGGLKINNEDDSSIKGFGTLVINNGHYTIYGQRLDISKGELHFAGPISNPTLDVKASRRSISGEVTAGVELGGTINHLQSSLYSEPVLSDLEILSYILSGRGLGEGNETNSEQLAQAAILLGLKKSSPIFTEIQTKLGIDVLTIKEGSSQTGSIVEAGKQFSDRLYVGYNHRLFSREGFWVLKYKINQALSLETTQGEDQSVDLIYRREKQ